MVTKRLGGLLSANGDADDVESRWQSTSSKLNGGGMRFLCLFTIMGVVSMSPMSDCATLQRSVSGYRNPPMMHSRRFLGGLEVLRRGSVSGEGQSVILPIASVNDRPVDGAYDNENELDYDGNALSAPPPPPPYLPEVAVPHPYERRSPFLPHLLGPASSGGVRKIVTTNGLEEKKRWAPTEIRMNEFIHKIQAVNAASRFNRRFYDPSAAAAASSDDEDWKARRERRQRQQQGTNAAQMLKLYGLRTRMGL